MTVIAFIAIFVFFIVNYAQVVVDRSHVGRPDASTPGGILFNIGRTLGFFSGVALLFWIGFETTWWIAVGYGFAAAMVGPLIFVNQQTAFPIAVFGIVPNIAITIVALLAYLT